MGKRLHNWKEIKLGTVCDKIGSGATPRGGSDVYIGEGVSLIRSQNVHNEGFKRNGLAHIGATHARQLAGVTVEHNDVLLNITGDSVARTCQVDSSILPARVNQHVAIIRPKEDVLSPRYLRYVMVQPSMQQHLLSLASSGATRNALTKQMIEDLALLLPPLSEQKAIAAVLSSLDDKIELLRRQNETLEQIAQAIFKEWFVEFNFPDKDGKPYKASGGKMVDSELGPIPEGWRVGTLGELLSLEYGKALREDRRTVGNIPVYGSNGKIGWHNEALVCGPGIVVGRKGNPGTVNWVNTDFFPIDTAFYVVPTETDMDYHYLYLTLKLQDLPNLEADSAVPGLNRNLAHMADLVIPQSAVINDFALLIEPLFLKQKTNNDQIVTVSAIRDTLLPKLMSGALRLKDFL